MRPDRSILHESFRYVPAATTSVAATWRRFGWRPTTDAERAARSRRRQVRVVETAAAPDEEAVRRDA